MKKSYQLPAMRVVKLQHRRHILAGSELYSVQKYNDGGSETVKDDSDW